MKKLLIALMFVTTIGCAGGVYDWINLTSIYNLNTLEETEVMNVSLKGQAGKDGQPAQSVIVEMSFTPEWVSVNTQQFLRVKTIRIKKDVMEDLFDIYKSMQR